MKTLTDVERARIASYRGYENVLELYESGLIDKGQLFEIIDILKEGGR